MATTSPTPSGPSTPASDSIATLTPSRKVKALLAQFSDSDSDSQPRKEQDDQLQGLKKFSHSITNQQSDSENESSDHDEVVQPRGRLAARLLGEKGLSQDTISKIVSNTLQSRDRISPNARSVSDARNKSNSIESSEDEITTAAPFRRRLLAGRRSDAEEMTAGPRVDRSESPLFFPSPNATRRTRSPSQVALQHSTPSPPVRSADKDGSKYLALVEKHRKERIAREAAEIVKKATSSKNADKSRPRKVRGSSPADDSDEESASDDPGAAKRMQQQIRPTRKASRKALEEMNRETQRMNRNMQLAHQATTKKKITKESLLARFGFAAEDVEPSMLLPPPGTTSKSGSNTNSDTESRDGHQSTPPTSPMRDIEDFTLKSNTSYGKDITYLFSTGQFIPEMHGALAPEDEVLAMEQSFEGRACSKSMEKVREYQYDYSTVMSPAPSKLSHIQQVALLSMNATMTSEQQPSKSKLARKLFVQLAGTDSEDDIEIVKDRGLKRKYAAFETLPKRKAKEMPSHLALRSLAHLVGNDDKKRSMNAAELQTALMKKARMQATEERQRRIEELRSKGVVVQTAEEREQDQQEVEDLVERARQEAVEIQKREKELAKKDGTYVKDNLDDDDDEESDDADFGEEEPEDSASDDEDEDEEDNEDENNGGFKQKLDLLDDEVEEAHSDAEAEEDEGLEEKLVDSESDTPRSIALVSSTFPKRNLRVLSDEEDEEENAGKKNQSPRLPFLAKTPVSVPRSVRKMIPGLRMSDDLPMDLSQAFAATMAESQTQDLDKSQDQDSLDLTAGLPSPKFAPVPFLQRFESVDLISDSQPSASQTRPLNFFSQSQIVPESPHGVGAQATQHTPSQRQMPFELTQDNGYILSPFMGNRFAETPNLNVPNSTVETVVVPHGVDDSPIVQRRSRLLRGRGETNRTIEEESEQPITAFQIMRQATKNKQNQTDFNKKESDARKIVDEAAEESEDEYAGLGGASDESGDDEENEDDRRMIDEDTQIGRGDEAKLAGLYADRERERDEKEVSKLLKDITTGALRRKRGVGDDLDLSDEEDAAARRREAKRREFARMRRELLKDEAVGKIAEDKKKEAFLRSIEDRDVADAEDDDFDQPLPQNSESQSQSQDQDILVANSQKDEQRNRPLESVSVSKLNQLPLTSRRTNPNVNRKPATLAEIRDSVSFLIEEPDSQAGLVDLGLSDSEEEPEAYVNLDRHLREAEADENELDDHNEDLGDFVVDDEPLSKPNSSTDIFKKPEIPRQERAPFAERRTKQGEVIDRLSLLRQNSSSTSNAANSSSNKMAFFSSKSNGSFSGVPTLLRRATTNSSLGSMSGRENVSATGVVTNKTERGNAGEEKEFIRKGNSGRRNAVNYQGERKTLREEKMSARAGVMKTQKGKKGKGFLGGLFRGDSWE